MRGDLRRTVRGDLRRQHEEKAAEMIYRIKHWEERMRRYKQEINTDMKGG
jgi:uncharacterized FlgJ-related protein